VSGKEIWQVGTNLEAVRFPCRTQEIRELRQNSKEIYTNDMQHSFSFPENEERVITDTSCWRTCVCALYVYFAISLEQADRFM
jgi:hypothetical protein